MWIRALLAFLALPGTVGILLPWSLAVADPRRDPDFPGNSVGALWIGLGLVVLVWCVRDFYIAGKGTLAPWEPPRKLVVVGLYRYVRNPMYLGVLTMVMGIGLWFGSPVVLAYGALLAGAFHLRVVSYEEPWQAEQFGSDWSTYKQKVRRWWPKLRPGVLEQTQAREEREG